MKTVLRVDKYLADMGIGTRTEVKNAIRKGCVKVNGDIIKKPETKVDIQTDQIQYQGEDITYVSYEYYMLNKPQGVVSATEDRHCETVLDLIEEKQRKDLFPVGRLDKDTEGLLLITNDGQLAHRLLSPKHHVGKVYEATIQGMVTKEDVEAFAKGIDSEIIKALPAKLWILPSDGLEEGFSAVRIEIYEGQFHQIKRMFEALDKEVVYLKRISMGGLKLDENLSVGTYRKLTEKEIEEIRC